MTKCPDPLANFYHTFCAKEFPAASNVVELLNWKKLKEELPFHKTDARWTEEVKGAG